MIDGKLRDPLVETLNHRSMQLVAENQKLRLVVVALHNEIQYLRKRITEDEWRTCRRPVRQRG